MVESDTLPMVEPTSADRQITPRPRRRLIDRATGSAERDATPRAFAALYQDEFLPMVRLATLLTGNTEVARDVVQDAFVKLHVKWLSVRNPAAYLRTSVVNGTRSFHRRRHRRGDVALSAWSEHEPASTENSSFDHTLVTLQALSDRERACIVLKFYAGLTEQQIASTVGCRPGSVGPTVRRALDKLRQHQ